jgi:dual specificity tyrosine-phosphorylation-regulated kinase 2/3/4
MSTPEYLAPEILEYLEGNGMTCAELMSEQTPWSYDIWSFGCIMLEIITGCPIWMSLKSRVVTSDGRTYLGHGLFASTGRQNKKIIAK